jgi:hypothetical protein
MSKKPFKQTTVGIFAFVISAIASLGLVTPFRT